MTDKVIVIGNNNDSITSKVVEHLVNKTGVKTVVVCDNEESIPPKSQIFPIHNTLVEPYSHPPAKDGKSLRRERRKKNRKKPR